MTEKPTNAAAESVQGITDAALATKPERRDDRVFTATYTATGRRKRSVARVILTPGAGAISINDKTAREYLPTEMLTQYVNEPFDVTQLGGRFDVSANAHGGGFSGQAGALRHAISRALSLIDETTRTQLKSAGLLSRDAREKERKKYGQRGARARFQFSKR
jgi:small subunit ribosomal protein S9